MTHNIVQTLEEHIFDYESIPVYVRAAKVDEDNIDALATWCGGDVRSSGDNIRYLVIPSTSGTVGRAATVGSYLVRDMQTGKFHACDAEDFEKEYRLDHDHVENEESDVDKDPTLYPDPDDIPEEGLEVKDWLQ